MNEYISEIHYDDKTGSILRQRLEKLQQDGDMTDLRIISKEQEELKAHRLILAARFPVLAGLMRDMKEERFEMTRFTMDIIKAMVSYAYLGKIEISFQNVGRLILLAKSFGCNEVCTWCIQFLKSRFSDEIFDTVWSVANIIKNDDLLHLCLPSIAALWERIIRRKNFFAFTDARFLEIILGDNRLQEVNAESKILAISAWIEAGITPKEQEARVEFFEELIENINVKSLTEDFFSDLNLSTCEILRFGNCREKLSDAKKRKQPEFDIYFHAGIKNGNASEGIMAGSRQLRGVGWNPTFRVPFLENCEIAVLGADVYLIGGGNEKENFNDVYVVKLPDGQVLRFPSMERGRRSPAVVVSSDGRIFVFGGSNNNEGALSSCEVFDPSKTTWDTLPQMPTSRRTFTAIHLPGRGYLAVGGFNMRNALSTVELLSEDASSWTELNPTMDNHMWPGMTLFRGRVVVAGGENQTSVECMSVASLSSGGQWTRLASFAKQPVNTRSSWFYSLFVYEKRLILSDLEGNVLEFAPGDSNSSIEDFRWKPLFKLEGFNWLHMFLVSREHSRTTVSESMESEIQGGDFPLLPGQ